MELTEIKSFLHVDFDDDDEYIALLIEVSKEYIKNAVGVYDDENVLARMAAMTIISSLYEARQFSADESNVSYIIKSMLTQLRLNGGGENDG